MRIRMLVTISGSEDGVVTRGFEAGSIYTPNGSPRARELADVFLREGWAVLVREEPVAEAHAAAPDPRPAQAVAPKARKR